MVESEKLEGQNGAHPGNGESVATDLAGVYRLIFFSTSLIPSVALGGDEDIRKLLKTAEAQNRKFGVTGVLFFNDFRFAGVLEGTEADVLEIFRSMQKDSRHADIVVVEESWLSRRGFTDWGMAYVADSGLPTLISADLNLKDILAPESWSAIAIVEMLKFFLLHDPEKS